MGDCGIVNVNIVDPVEPVDPVIIPVVSDSRHSTTLITVLIVLSCTQLVL